LLREVFISAEGFELDTEGIVSVKKWTRDIVQRLRNAVWGGDKVGFGKEERKMMQMDFRLRFEVVWKGYMADRRRAGVSRAVREVDEAGLGGMDRA